MNAKKPSQSNQSNKKQTASRGSSPRSTKYNQPASKKQPIQPERRLRIFNIFFGVLLIGGMLVSAVGGRSLSARKRSQAAAPTPNADSGTIVLSWRREDATSGACDELGIVLDGRALADHCANNSSQPSGLTQLTADQQTQLVNWMQKYTAFTLHPKDTGGGEKISLSLAFKGRGSQTVSDQDLQDMETLAEGIFAQASQNIK